MPDIFETEQRTDWLDMLYPEPPTEQARLAMEAKRTYAATAAQIRADERLSDAAKVADIAALYQQTAGKLEQHMEAESVARTKRVEELQRTAFGLGRSGSAPSDAISMRDASDRAARLTDPADALDLMQRARRNGDAVLERAVALHVYERAQGALGAAYEMALEDYFEAHPESHTQMTELQSLQEFRTDEVWASWFTQEAPPEVRAARMANFGQTR